MAVAMDAIGAASRGHHFISVTRQGISAIAETIGNNSCHVILRGGKTGPNYASKNVNATTANLIQHKLRPLIMIDCSHGNSSNDYKRQIIVAEDIAKQLPNPHETGKNIIGVMTESNLVEGRQDILAEGAGRLIYGKSITDACINWENTVEALDILRDGVHASRAIRNR
jgi:3-deoxy-7-phosphoheptulonate synthase